MISTDFRTDEEYIQTSTSIAMALHHDKTKKNTNDLNIFKINFRLLEISKIAEGFDKSKIIFLKKTKMFFIKALKILL